MLTNPRGPALLRGRLLQRKPLSHHTREPQWGGTIRAMAALHGPCKGHVQPAGRGGGRRGTGPHHKRLGERKRHALEGLAAAVHGAHRQAEGRRAPRQQRLAGVRDLQVGQQRLAVDHGHQHALRVGVRPRPPVRQQRLPLLVLQQLAALQHLVQGVARSSLRLKLAGIDDGDLRKHGREGRAGS